MKFSKLFLAASTAVACLAGGAAHSAGTLTNIDTLSPFVNFGGFDWAAGGAAWTDGVVAAEAAFIAAEAAVPGSGTSAAGNLFTIRFASLAVGLIDPTKAAIPNANLDATADGAATGAGTYEYTTFVEVKLKVTAYVDLTALSLGTLVCAPPPCVLIGLETVSGTFDIYYDTTPDAIQLDADTSTGLWDGFTNGVNLIKGTLTAGTSNSFSDLSAVNGFGFDGAVISQSAHITPDMTGTTFSSEFKFGLADTGFKNPLSVDGMAINQDPAVEDIFSVDASQLFFFATPEPISLLLVGGALVAAGGASRRRSKR